MRVDVSVVMAAYDAQAFLARAIASVQGQTFSEWELIVVDDASSDGTLEIAHGLAAVDPRIRVLHRSENGGPGRSRNAAIEAARGRYVAFLDADDEWLPRKLEAQLAFMRERDVHLSYTAYERISESGQKVGVVRAPARATYGSLLRGSRIGCLTAVYDRDLTGTVTMPTIRKRQDLGLWLAITKRFGPAAGLDSILARYTIRRGSVSADKVLAARYQWRLYREVEGLGLVRSTSNFAAYAINGVARRVREL